MLNIIRNMTFVIFLAVPQAASAEAFLYMAKEDGCMWCARWHAEVGPGYPKTPEGRLAPLRQFDLQGEHPRGIDFSQKVHFSPTFILVENGAEVGRIEGYPGADHFWGLLEMIFEQSDINLDTLE